MGECAEVFRRETDLLLKPKLNFIEQNSDQWPGFSSMLLPAVPHFIFPVVVVGFKNFQMAKILLNITGCTEIE